MSLTIKPLMAGGAQAAIIVLLTAFLSACLFVPIPINLLQTKPDPVILNSTKTDREIVDLLPADLALDYINNEAPNESCRFITEGIVLSNGVAYDFNRFAVNEVKLAGESDQYSIFVFANNKSATDGLVCSWQQLNPTQSEKLLTSLASLGLQYR